jgi:hypothetical protein
MGEAAEFEEALARGDYDEPPDFDDEPQSWGEFVRAAGRWIREDAAAAGRSVRYRRIKVVRGDAGCTCGLFSWPWHVTLDPPISLRDLWFATGQGGAHTPDGFGLRRRHFDASVGTEGGVFYSICRAGDDHLVEQLPPQAVEDHQHDCPCYSLEGHRASLDPADPVDAIILHHLATTCRRCGGADVYEATSEWGGTSVRWWCPVCGDWVDVVEAT